MKGVELVAQKSFNHISDETKEKINSAIEASGLNDKEWIDRAIEVWSLHAMKGEIPGFRMEIEEVEALTNRIRSVLVHIAQRTAFEKDETRLNWEEALEEKRLMIEEMNGELLDLGKQLKAAIEETNRQSQLREEADKYSKQVEQSSDSNRALAESYKDKNETLTDLVAQYKSGYEESRTLREELKDCQRTIATIEKELAAERENLESLSRINEERIRQLEEKHKGELERAVERREVEHERELLRVRTEHQAQLQATTHESTNEIRGLYERIERLRGENEQTIENIRNDYEKRFDAVSAERDAIRAELERLRRGE
jgi:chromosome segregation ATPase